MRAYSFYIIPHGEPPRQWGASESGQGTRNRYIHAKYLLYADNPGHPGDRGPTRPCPGYISYPMKDNTWKDRPVYVVYLYTIGTGRQWRENGVSTIWGPITWGVCWRRDKADPLYQHFFTQEEAASFYIAKCDE